MKKLLASVRDYVKTHPCVDFAFLVSALIVFVTVALGNISRASIWFDEAFSTYLAQFSYWDIARYTATDVHPPLYYWFLKTWTMVFGTDEIGFRSMSLFFGVLAIIGAFFLARKLFGRRVVVTSLLFLMVSPLLVRYSNETRMYTMAASISIFATLAMLKAQATKSRKWWVTYGVLVSAGMWTHYFTALIWIAHWVWHGLMVFRKNDTLKSWRKKFFSREWVRTYVLAVLLYVPWLPFFVYQTGMVQAGFWIADVGVDTLPNYMTNYFFYLEHGSVTNWWAMSMIAVFVLTVTLAPRVYRRLGAAARKNYLLLLLLAWFPPVFLFVLSMPPLSSLFVERYFVPSIVLTNVFFAATLVIGMRGTKPWLQAIPVSLVVLMMSFGVTQVYAYGNYNRNSNTHVLTGEVVQLIHEASPGGAVIIASTPWVFYEASFYATEDYPIYFIDEATDYYYGSLAMLENEDQHKILDLDAFLEENPTIWYLAGTEEPVVAPYEDDWMPGETVGAYSPITQTTIYKATQYFIAP